jgi:hypothetical protein
MLFKYTHIPVSRYKLILIINNINYTWVVVASEFSVPPEVTQSKFSSLTKHAKMKKGTTGGSGM